MSDSGDIREQLEKLHDELEASLRGVTEDAKPVDLELSIGRLSRMDAIQGQELAMKRKAKLRQRLAMVRQAMLRVADGVYGECARCGETISAARLAARPEVPVCLSCQEEIERR